MPDADSFNPEMGYEGKKGKFLNKFDIVVASEVIEHVNERKIFLSDISKLSRSGGLIVFTTINKSFLGVIKFNFLGLTTRRKIIALGGINQRNIKRLLCTKSKGYAGISGIKKPA